MKRQDNSSLKLVKLYILLGAQPGNPGVSVGGYDHVAAHMVRNLKQL